MAAAGYAGWPELPAGHARRRMASASSRPWPRSCTTTSASRSTSRRSTSSTTSSRSRRARTPTLWSLSWIADYPHAHDFLGLLLETGSTSNTGKWSNAALRRPHRPGRGDNGRRTQQTAIYTPGAGHPGQGRAGDPGLVRRVVGAQPHRSCRARFSRESACIRYAGHAMGAGYERPMRLRHLSPLAHCGRQRGPVRDRARTGGWCWPRDQRFGTPSVTAELGQPLTFTSTIDGATSASVDVLIHLVGNPTSIVVNAGHAAQQHLPGAGRHRHLLVGRLCLPGQRPERAEHAFRLPVPRHQQRRRHEPWPGCAGRRRGQPLHVADADQGATWSSTGTRAIRRSPTSAADAANAAIDKASQSAGRDASTSRSTCSSTTRRTRCAAPSSPDRENVAGEAHPDIDTMFVWLPSNQAADPYNQTRHTPTS